MSTPDYPDWQTPQAHADAIALTGVGLLGSHVPLGSPLVGVTIPAGMSVTAFSDVVTGASYYISMSTLNVNGATSTAPFTKVTMSFKDQAGGTQLPLLQFFTLQTNISPADSNAQMVGKGPCDGGFLTIILKNTDPVNPVTVNFAFIQSGQAFTHHDWFPVSNNIAGDYTFFAGVPVSTPVSAPAADILGCSTAITIPAFATTGRINAFYNGQIQLCITQPSTGNLEYALIVFDPEFAFPAITLPSDNPNTKPVNGVNFSLPKFPVILQLTNLGNAPLTAAYSMVPQRYST